MFSDSKFDLNGTLGRNQNNFHKYSYTGQVPYHLIDMFSFSQYFSSFCENHMKYYEYLKFSTFINFFDLCMLKLLIITFKIQKCQMLLQGFSLVLKTIKKIETNIKNIFFLLSS